jgi:hypothetical protein
METDDCAVLELRRYAMQPGRRDALIDLFEKKLLEPQEALGMKVAGQFRDLDVPDRFVWLRGHRSMEARKEALKTFYTGATWARHRGEANSTIADSDDVFLLRPMTRGSRIALSHERIPAEAGAPSVVVASICQLREPADEAFAGFFESRVEPALIEIGAPPIAVYCTEPRENDFPIHPVRAGENALVWFSAFDSTDHHRTQVESAPRSKAWSEALAELMRRAKSPIETQRLEPTARSLFGRRPGDVHDFDFIAGRWNVANRRLKARGVGTDAWDEFPATAVGRLHLGGVANIDEISFPTRGASGLSVRTFDRKRREWSISWISSQEGRLFSPVHGGFSGDRGLFFGDDEDGGREVRVRYTWTKPAPDEAHWAQAFSYDRGATWETNWLMDFTRARD